MPCKPRGNSFWQLPACSSGCAVGTTIRLWVARAGQWHPRPPFDHTVTPATPRIRERASTRADTLSPDQVQLLRVAAATSVVRFNNGSNLPTAPCAACLWRRASSPCHVRPVPAQLLQMILRPGLRASCQGSTESRSCGHGRSPHPTRCEPAHNRKFPRSRAHRHRPGSR